MILEGIKLCKNFGGLTALRDVSFVAHEGEIVGLIGPNGAGKTTLFNAISGLYTPTKGKVVFRGRDITGLVPYKICKLGLARTFQIVNPFADMSALENVMVGLLANKSIALSSAHSEALECLKLVGLEDKSNLEVKSLTLSQTKFVELARALSTHPTLLLIDELVAGLNPSETVETIEVVKEIRNRGITILWVEHVMHAIMNVADRIMVLDRGVKIAEGSPREVADNEAVVKAYLGGR